MAGARPEGDLYTQHQDIARPLHDTLRSLFYNGIILERTQSCGQVVRSTAVCIQRQEELHNV